MIATYITDDAEALGAEGIPENLHITCCDIIDRLYLSTNPEILDIIPSKSFLGKNKSGL